MTQIFFFIDQLAIGIYALLFAIVLFNVYRAMRAQGQKRATYFELERDLARQRQFNAITAMIIAIQLGVMVLGVQESVVPFLESEQTLEEMMAGREQVADDRPFATDTPLPPGAIEGGIDIPEVTIAGPGSEAGFIATPTLTPTPVGTIIPGAPPSEGCIDDRANLQIPANGMRVFAPITVRGTAFTDNFSSAKIEISGPTTNDQYWVVDTITQPVRSLSEFSQFIPAGYLEGRHQFRLTIFDNFNQLVASCMVNIYISELQPTPTLTPRPGATAAP